MANRLVTAETIGRLARNPTRSPAPAYVPGAIKLNVAILNAEIAGDGVIINVVSEQLRYLAIKPFLDKLSREVGKASAWYRSTSN